MWINREKFFFFSFFFSSSALIFARESRQSALHFRLAFKWNFPISPTTHLFAWESQQIANKVRFRLAVSSEKLANSCICDSILNMSAIFHAGWGGRIWTYACKNQNLVPYRLATPHHFLGRVTMSFSPPFLCAFKFNHLSIFEVPSSHESHSKTPM